ncbi:MAG TPA: histidine phosphatase family protein [Candidatus Limnocylindrales bacterium]|nr:histidine phosphatase family protein [Candidatus Limnocylindrales bacterium]
MILYFLRHADAGPVGATAAEDDARRLTAGGEAELQGAAELWRRLRVRPEVVISSPLPRAQRAAELLVDGIGSEVGITVDERLRPGATWSDLSAALADHHTMERALFVGHQPDLARVIELLSGASRVAMQLGSLACLEFEGEPAPGAGRLNWLLDPHLYLSEFDHEH